MDTVTKLEILSKEISEASYYGGVESRVMEKWADYKELCVEHKRLVQELVSANCAEWFKIEAPTQPPAREQVQEFKAKPLEEPPREYLLHKLEMVMPLFQEARDALTCISVAQRILNKLAPDLAFRMDEAGTYNLDKWKKENQQ